MPALDRLIRLERDHGRSDQAGRFAHDWRLLGVVWATRVDRGVQDTFDDGIQRNIASVSYTIRWRADVVETPPSLLRVVDRRRIYSSREPEDDLHWNDFIEAPTLGDMHAESYEFSNVDRIVQDPGPRSERRRFVRLEMIEEV